MDTQPPPHPPPPYPPTAESPMDALRPSGRTRPHEPGSPTDAPARSVRQRTSEPSAPGPSDLPAGPAARAPLPGAAPQGLAPRARLIPPSPPRPATPPPLDADPDGTAVPPARESPPPGSLDPDGYDAELRDAASWLMDLLNHAPAQPPEMLQPSDEEEPHAASEAESASGLPPLHAEPAPAVETAARRLLRYRNGTEADDAAPAGAVPWDAEAELALDLARQTQPLGREMAWWTGGTAAPGDRFDDELHAPAFNRLLARLRETLSAEASSATAAERTGQVAAVIDAIHQSPALREQVFLVAQTALGSCADNVLEGFSKILLAVRDHQMVDGIRSGRVDAAQFHRWADQQLRLMLLESEVHRFIEQQLRRPDLEDRLRKRLTEEPLETMVHAKQSLRERLDLPEGTVSGTTGRGVSGLRQEQLAALEQAVLRQANHPATRSDFLMGHSTWRAGMQALHPEEFRAHVQARDADAFFDQDVPEDLEGQADYAARARAVEAHWRHEEDRLLRRLAGFDAPGHGPAGPGPSGP